MPMPSPSIPPVRSAAIHRATDDHDPMDPTLPLAFWQAIARRIAPPGDLDQVTREADLHGRTPLVQAAENLDAALVADLLDDPEVRHALLVEAQVDDADGESDTLVGDNLPETALDAALYSNPHAGGVSNRTPTPDPEGEAWAATLERSKTVIVAMLLAAGAVPNPIAWLALGTVNTPSLVDRLMAAGHSPRRMDHPHARAMGVASTALHRSAERSAAVSERLLAHGWDVNGLDAQGRTPLHEALDAHGAGAVPLLLAHGAHTVWPEHGDHALITVARRGNVAALDVLMDHGAVDLLERPASDDLTPLNHALNAGRPHLAERLLAYGARPDAHSLSLAHAARERAGDGGMFPTPTGDREAWQRLLVALETRALRAALPPDLGPSTPPPDASGTLPSGRANATVPTPTVRPRGRL